MTLLAVQPRIMLVGATAKAAAADTYRQLNLFGDVFERVRGSRYPLAINVLATPRRIEWAIGRHPEAVAETEARALHFLPPAEEERVSPAGRIGRPLVEHRRATGARDTRNRSRRTGSAAGTR